MLKRDNYPNYSKIAFLTVVLTALMFGNIGAFGVREAGADPYFNSAETGCNPSSPNPNYLMCDDFDDGNWFLTPDDPGNSANDGWIGVQTSGGSPLNPPPPATACSGAGAAGTICTSYSTSSGGDGGGSAQGLHGLAPACSGSFGQVPSETGCQSGSTTYREIYYRFYLKLSSGMVNNGSQKFFSLIRAWDAFGIDFGGAITRNVRSLLASPQFDCNDNNYRNPQSNGNVWCYINQNQGNDITLQDNRWYYIEFHIRFNNYSVRNGIWQVWANDCGTNGICTGSPTLRASYTNVGWQGSDSNGTTQNGLLGTAWTGIWGNPADVGTFYIDQIIIAKAGPIGFVGAATPPTSPPASPTALQVQP